MRWHLNLLRGRINDQQANKSQVQRLKSSRFNKKYKRFTIWQNTFDSELCTVTTVVIEITKRYSWSALLIYLTPGPMCWQRQHLTKIKAMFRFSIIAGFILGILVTWKLQEMVFNYKGN